MKNTADKNASTEMNTLAECMNKKIAEGYTQNFSVNEKGLQAADSKKVYQPAEVRIVNFYRFEGNTDPADSAMLYVLETNDGLKGLLSDAYGVYADGKTASFIKQVEDMTKDTDRLDAIPNNPRTNL